MSDQPNLTHVAILRAERSSLMYHAQCEQIVELWQENGKEDASLLVIMRGLPGSGKSTMSAQIKISAEVQGMTAVICSADAYFTSAEGYYWVKADLGKAHEYCMYCVRTALARGVNIVIVDNTNCKYSEWREYERLTYQKIGWGQFRHIHGVCRINFARDSVERALELSNRAKSSIPVGRISSRFEHFHSADRFFFPHFTVQPIENTWSEVGPPMSRWAEQDRDAPLNWTRKTTPDRADPRNYQDEF